MQLTGDGVTWVRERMEMLEALVESKAPAGVQRSSQRHLIALERSVLPRRTPPARRWRRRACASPTCCACTPDADGRAWRERLETYRSAAEQAERQMPLDFLARLEREHPDWFEVNR